MEKLLVKSNFSFTHSVFKRLVLQTRKNKGLFRKELEHGGKGENAGKQHLLIFPVFYPVREIQTGSFVLILNLSSAGAFNFKVSSFCHLVRARTYKVFDEK